GVWLVAVPAALAGSLAGGGGSDGHRLHHAASRQEAVRALAFQTRTHVGRVAQGQGSHPEEDAMSTQSRIDAEARKDPETLEREIDQKRSDINHLVEALESKLSPGQ